MATEAVFVWTSVRAVCREYPVVEALPHALQLMTAYVGKFSLYALPNVLKRGQTRMFYHALHAVGQSLTLVHHEKLRQYRLAMHLVPAKMTAEEGALKAMQELYAQYAGCVDSDTIAAACEMADLSVLKWLHACEPNLLFAKFEWSDTTAFIHASRKGRLDVVRWLTELFPDRVRTLVHAAHGGHFNMVKWLMKQPQWDHKVDDAFFVAVARGHINVARFLQEKRSSGFMNVQTRFAYECGLEMVAWRRNAYYDRKYSAVEAAASGNHIEMVKWLHVNYSMHFSANTMDCAAWNGHLEVVRFLHFNRQEGCTTRAMDGAAENGHLEVVQWLHENRSEGCTPMAMDSAASNGHLNILKWLCDNRHEGCTTRGMVKAVRQDRFEIAKWLSEHQNHEFPGEIVDKLVLAGDLETITWLHSNGKGDGWSKETMNKAASNGHLDIVKFLHENRREGCTKQAMNLAAGNNHLDVVKWLHANRREGCSVLAMTNAASQGHLEMIKWLHTHRGEGCTPAAMTGSAAGGHIRVMEFLATNFSLQWPPTTMKYAVENNQLAAVKWLHVHLRRLSKKDAIHAARSENIGILEYIRSTAEDCITPTVYFVGYTKNYLEVVKWYEDHYGNPRKRKTPPQ